LEWAEPIAYGPLNLMPGAFEQLQPHEFVDLWDGYKWRQEQEENRLAYFTACQMSVHTSKPVSPKDLLKPLRQTVKQRDRKDDEEYFKEKFKNAL